MLHPAGSRRSRGALGASPRGLRGIQRLGLRPNEPASQDPGSHIYGPEFLAVASSRLPLRQWGVLVGEDRITPLVGIPRPARATRRWRVARICGGLGRRAGSASARCLLGVALLAASLAVALGGSLASAPSAQAAPAAPEVGNCYAYPRFETVKAAEARAIACRRSHAGETFYVGTLPKSLGPPRKATFAQRAAAAKPCTEAAMHQAIGLGGRKIPSRFEVVVVFPTNAQWRDGARWLRCDAALLQGGSYVRLKTTLATAIAKASPGAFDFCTPKVPGSRAKVASRCTKPNQNWILIAEPRIAAASSAFPGLPAVTREAKALCKKAAEEFDDPQDRWWAIWPKKAGWKAGYRLAMCFVPYSAYTLGHP